VIAAALLVFKTPSYLGSTRGHLENGTVDGLHNKNLCVMDNRQLRTCAGPYTNDKQDEMLAR
jgi:hypothetical protein